MDCGSCSEEIVKMVEKHCKHFYIRANRCPSLYDDIFALRGWKKEVINDLEFELNSILVEKWKGKAYRLVIQRQKRIDGDLDHYIDGVKKTIDAIVSIIDASERDRASRAYLTTLMQVSTRSVCLPPPF